MSFLLRRTHCILSMNSSLTQRERSTLVDGYGRQTFSFMSVFLKKSMGLSTHPSLKRNRHSRGRDAVSTLESKYKDLGFDPCSASN